MNPILKYLTSALPTPPPTPAAGTRNLPSINIRMIDNGWIVSSVDQDGTFESYAKDAAEICLIIQKLVEVFDSAYLVRNATKESP